VSRLTELIQQETGTAENAFQRWFSETLDKGIEQFRKSPSGIAIKRKAVRQELNDIANSPILLIALILFFAFLIRR